MRISILSNVNLDMLSGLLKKENEIFQADGYGEWVSYALRGDKKLTGFAPECLILLLDGNELLGACTTEGERQAELERTAEYAEGLAEHYKTSYLLVSTIDVRPDSIRGKDTNDEALLAAAYWDRQLTALTERCSNVHRLELRQLIEDYGRKNFYSKRFWYMGSIPYDMKALHVLAEEIQKVLGKLKAIRKKVLVLDLDNTLWGGVVGEDGTDGIVLGPAHEGAVYQDAQKVIKKMQKQGVLLAIASKNNLSDVQKVFRENPHMVLKESDFAVIYADWNPKSENVRKIAEELNLGMDAFVFFDDNEAERKAMELNLPEVTVAEFPADISELANTLQKIYDQYFWSFRLTEEDRGKTRQYQEEKLRQETKNAAVSYEAYLKSLETKVVLTKAAPELMERAVQLMNKTNQFNVCTLRMDELELEKYLTEKNGHLLMAEVSDKYGNSGWVAEFLYHIEGNTAVVDNFLMSCRVMGRQIEDAIAGAVLHHLEAEKIQEVKAFYRKTAKNKPVEELWERLGFEKLEEKAEEKRYRLCLPQDPDEKTAEQVHTVIWR